MKVFSSRNWHVWASKRNLIRFDCPRFFIFLNNKLRYFFLWKFDLILLKNEFQIFFQAKNYIKTTLFRRQFFLLRCIVFLTTRKRKQHNWMRLILLRSLFLMNSKRRWFFLAFSHLFFFLYFLIVRRSRRWHEWKK